MAFVHLLILSLIPLAGNFSLYGIGIAWDEPVLGPHPNVLHAAFKVSFGALHSSFEAASYALIYVHPAGVVRLAICCQGNQGDCNCNAFPLVIACCIPIRLFLLPKIFTQGELVMIDTDDETVKAWLTTHGEVRTPSDSEEKPDDEEMQQQPSAETETDVAGLSEAEEHVGEEYDQVSPLPDTGASLKQRTARRRRRKKSLSCPTPHLFFADVPYSATDIDIGVIHEETHPEQEEPPAAEGERLHHHHHPHRRKSVSCPPHMLFAEAERQVASNYFFG